MKIQRSKLVWPGHVSSLSVGYLSERRSQSRDPLGSAEVIVANAFQVNFSLCSILLPSRTLTNKSLAHNFRASWGIKFMSEGHLGEDAQEATTFDSGGQQR